jgi:acyl-CoA dehydrogenase
MHDHERDHDPGLAAALGQLLQDHCPPARVRAAEAGEPAPALWAALEASGFLDALVPETRGGAGLALPAVHGLLALGGEFAVPAPLAATLLARGLIAASGADCPAGAITIAPQAQRDTEGLGCAAVADGRVADWVLTQADDGQALLLPVAAAWREPAVFALDLGLRWDAPALATARPVPGRHDLEALLACATAAQLAGAMGPVLQRSLAHANERQQFGRPIGKFQAIQHQLAVMAEQVAAARMAAQIGCQALGPLPERQRVAVAKARCSEAAAEVAAAAHAIHGAIGFTAELDLQLHTRRLHAWRQRAGSESYWQAVLGEALVDAGQGLPALDLLRGLTDPGDPTLLPK